MDPKKILESEIKNAIIKFEKEIGLSNIDLVIKVKHEWCYDSNLVKTPIRRNIDIKIKL